MEPTEKGTFAVLIAEVMARRNDATNPAEQAAYNNALTALRREYNTRYAGMGEHGVLLAQEALEKSDG